MATTAVPEDVRSQVDRWAAAWLATFSPLLKLRAADPGAFAYPTALFSEWRGATFFLGCRYAGGQTGASEVVRQTRMTAAGFGRFDLAYRRHTNRWFTAYRGLTASECCQTIEDDEVFWPTT